MASDTNIINLSSLNNLNNSFKSEKNKYSSYVKNVFNVSYLNNCSDSVVKSMASKLNRKYTEIEKGYKNISKWFDDYVSNASSVESFMASDSKTSSAAESSIKNYLDSNMTFDTTSNKLEYHLVGPTGMMKSDEKEHWEKITQKVDSNTNTDSKLSTIAGKTIENIMKDIGENVVYTDNVESNVGTIVSQVVSQVIDIIKDKIPDENIEKALENKTIEFSEKVEETLNYIKEEIETEGLIRYSLKSLGKVLDSGSVNSAVDDRNIFQKGWDKLKETGVKAWNGAKKVVSFGVKVVKKTAATVATVVASIVEGLCKLIESLLDTLDVIATVVLTPYTTLFDLVGYALGNDNGLSLTKEMWSNTMSFVSEKHVENAFDKFYENTKAGQFIKENAIFFDGIRGITNGVAEVAGVILLSVLTAGIYDVVEGVTIGTTAVTSITPIIAGLSGAGKGYEKAWGEGASAGGGLAYGTIRGLWDAVQWRIGGKISGLNKFSSETANQMTRIGLDAVTGGVESPADAAFMLTYRDGYYNEEGEFVKFDENLSFFDKYSMLFNESGGFGTVAIDTLTAGGLSFAGERMDLAKKLKTRQETAESLNKSFKKLYDEGNYEDIIKVFEKEGYSESQIKNMFDNFDKDALVDKATELATDRIMDNIVYGSENNASEQKKKKKESLLDKIKKFFKKDNKKITTEISSEERYLKYMYDFHMGQYTEVYDGITFTSNSKEGLEKLKNLFNEAKKVAKDDIQIEYNIEKMRKNKIIFTDVERYGESSTGAYQVTGTPFIFFPSGKENDFSTLFHETGHNFDNGASNYAVGQKYVDDALSKLSQEQIEKAHNRLLKDYNQYSSKLREYLNSTEMQKEIKKVADTEYYKQFSIYDKDAYNKVYNDVYFNKFFYKDKNINTFYAISDMIDAAAGGKYTDLPSGHFMIPGYWEREGSVSTETMAEYFSLIGNNDRDMLDLYFPKEYRQTLEKAKEEILDTEMTKQALDHFKNVQNSKYGEGNFEKSMLEYLNTGDDTKLTRTEGVRDIVKDMDDLELKYYLTTSDNVKSMLDYSESVMDAKYGTGSFKNSLAEYISGGKEETKITNDKYVREYIKLLSDDQIVMYLNGQL